MAIHSSILACEMPWTEEPYELQSMGPQRVAHNWATEQVHWIKVVFNAELVPLECVLPGTSLEVQGLRLHASNAEGRAQVWSLVGELGSKRKKKKKVECMPPNMFLLDKWTYFC